MTDSHLPNTLSRKCGDTIVTIVWPADRKRWIDLPSDVRNQIRDFADAAIDLMERAS